LKISDRVAGRAEVARSTFSTDRPERQWLTMLLLPVPPLLEGTEEDLDEEEVVVIVDAAVDVVVDVVTKERRNGPQSPSLVV
jgi:hypothetical protein